MGFNSINRSRKLERQHHNGTRGNRPPAVMFTGPEFNHGAAITAAWVANPQRVDALLAEMKANSRRPFRRSAKPGVVAQAKAQAQAAPIDPRKLLADMKADLAAVKAERQAEADEDAYRGVYGPRPVMRPTQADEDAYRGVYGMKGA